MLSSWPYSFNMVLNFIPVHRAPSHGACVWISLADADSDLMPSWVDSSIHGIHICTQRGPFRNTIFPPTPQRTYFFFAAAPFPFAFAFAAPAAGLPVENTFRDRFHANTKSSTLPKSCLGLRM